jgi:uncharacterized repeat protein (TIGR03803 family)
MVLNLAKCTLVFGLIVTLSGVCKAPAALAAPQLTVLHSFAGGNDGRNVSGPLVRDAKGAIYGSTTEGGLYDRGTVFKLTPSTASDGEWKRTTLHDFRGRAQGIWPGVDLLMSPDGALYGVTPNARVSCRCGLVFKLAPPESPHREWTYTVVHNLGTLEDVAVPASLSMGPDGALYGTTTEHPNGVVYRLKLQGSEWTFSLLHKFKRNGSDGAHPSGGVVFDKSGALYGVTDAGGACDLINAGNCSNKYPDGCGVIYRLTPVGDAWHYDVLHNFTCDTEGASPNKLTFNRKGALYGNATFGGAGDVGTMFRLRPPRKSQSVWLLEALHIFGKPGGDQPANALVMGHDGAFYGTAANGSKKDGGTLFKVTREDGHWRYSVVWRFADRTVGQHPGPLVADKDGALYTTLRGGRFGYGAVVRITP